jgi:hypothetical protein
MASFLQKIARMISSTPPQVAASAMPKSRNVARERLSLILASQRGSEVLEKVDIESLQRDVMEVIKVRACDFLQGVEIIYFEVKAFVA